MALDITDSLVGTPIRAKREGAGRPGEPKLRDLRCEVRWDLCEGVGKELKVSDEGAGLWKFQQSYSSEEPHVSRNRPSFVSPPHRVGGDQLLGNVPGITKGP